MHLAIIKLFTLERMVVVPELNMNCVAMFINELAREMLFKQEKQEKQQLMQRQLKRE